MLYLIVANNTRDTQFERAPGDWVDGYGQLVLGTLYADDYEDAIYKGARKYNIITDNVDAYELVD